MDGLLAEFTDVVHVEFYIGVVTTLKMLVMLAPVPEVIGFTDEKVVMADESTPARCSSLCTTLSGRHRRF